MKKLDKFKRSLRSFLIVLVSFLVIACTPQKAIMPEVHSDHTINFRTNKNLNLYWQVGKKYNRFLQSSANQSSILASIIEDYHRNARPSDFTQSYAEPEQAIFMTSLKEYLEANHAFKNVHFVQEFVRPKNSDIALGIYFKSARVSPYSRLQVTITVQMTIKANGLPDYTRTYVAVSEDEDKTNKEGEANNPKKKALVTFVDHQSDASERMLVKIISGLESWYKTVYLRRQP